jgi:hypothetical protein
MARSSYFHALAPAGGDAPAAVLTPTPPLFRPGAAPAAFVEIDGRDAPPRRSIGGRPPAAADRPTPPGRAVAAPRDLPRDAVPRQASHAGTAAPPVAAALAPTAPAALAARPAAVVAAPRPTGQAETPPAPRAPVAAAPQPITQPERPRPDRPATAPAPLVAPPPPAPRQAAVPRPSGPAGVHIGTLEVRVTAPSTPPQTAPQRPRFAARALARHPARNGGRLSHGFGVFGLGQS